jgi:vancomycin resistance protein VanJ
MATISREEKAKTEKKLRRYLAADAAAKQPLWVPAPRHFSRLQIATVLGLASVLCAWTLENFVGERFGATALLTYFPQYGFALLPLVLSLLALRKGRNALFFLNIFTLFLWAKLLLGFSVPTRILAQDKSAPTVRVITYNVQRGERGVENLSRTLKEQHPDIICLQESQRSEPHISRFPGDRLQSEFRGWNVARAGDVMTLSHFPLLRWHSYPLRGTRHILETTYSTPQGELRVLNVHVSTSLRGQPYPPMEKKGRLRQIVSKAQPAAQVRLDQRPALQRAIAAGNSQTPLVMAGDFNTPPRGLFYRALESKLDDAWTQSGWGTGHTFPSHLPLLRIDYIFLRGAQSKRAFVPRSRASDHLPLVVDVALKNAS